MWAVAISGWIVALAVLRWGRKPDTGTEAQLQQTMREFANAKSAWRAERAELDNAHRAQMDAIRASVVEFELENPSDVAAVKDLIDELISKTKTRGVRNS